TGTLIVGGAASGSATITEITGSLARGGSGTCAQLTPTSTTAYGYWWFYIPVTNSSSFILTFYNMITSGWNGILNITIYDTDQSTSLYSSVVTTVNNSSYNQQICSLCTPTGTGLVLVKIGIMNGSVSGSV